MMYEKQSKCLRCGESRYKLKNNDVDDDDGVRNKGSLAKVMSYLPIMTRFKRMFVNVNDANNIRWHADTRKYNGKIHHVAGSLQWKKIDSLFSDFDHESRNLRLGLATD